MERCMLKEARTSIRIIPGPNGISFSNEEHNDGKFVEGNINNNIHKNGLIMDGLSQEESEILRVLKKSVMVDREAGGYYHQSRPKAAENSFQVQRVAVTGKRMKDSEIGIFRAEKYFTTEEEKKLDENEPIWTAWNPAENSEVKNQAKNKVISNPELLYASSRQRISSPLPSLNWVRWGLETRRNTSTASSEASWNSHSGMFPPFSSKFPPSERKKSTPRRWRIVRVGCPFTCSKKKSVEMDNSLICNRRNSLSSSSAFVDSPLSSFKYTYSGVGKRLLSRSIEKKKSDPAFDDNASEISHINSSKIKIDEGRGVKSLLDPLAPIVNQNCGISKDRELLQRRIVQKEDGFSFHVKDAFPQETPRLSLEVFGSNFPTTPDRHETIHPLDLHGHSELLSLDQAQRSFTLNSDASKCININNGRPAEDGDQDKESDSSFDLFEIQSFTTEETCYPLKSRDSTDDIFSIQPDYPASSKMSINDSLNFWGIEEPVTPSAQISYYEPSEFSVDFSVATVDTMDKASLGIFSSDFEDWRMIKRRPFKGKISDLGKATNKGGRSSKGSLGGFLGCGSQKSLSVVPSTHVSNIKNYDQRGISRSDLPMSKFRIDNLGLAGGRIQSQNRLTNINGTALSGRRSTAKWNKHIVN